MGKLFTFILLIVIAVPAFSATRTVAFERDNAIWIANLDGTDAKKIADGNLPQISPDGARVAFNTDEPGSKTPVRHIATIEIATLKTNVFKNVPSDNSFGPTWSPDGKSLLFSIFMEGNWQLAFVNSDGTGFRIVKKVARDAESCSMPVFAVDGKSFFCHDLDAIYQFSMDGTQIKKWEIHSILDQGDMNSNSRISLSADGQSIIMDIDMDEENNRENWDGPPPAIWAFNLNETKAVRLTKKGSFAWDPCWINADEYLFIAQDDKEDEPSIYRGSRNGGADKLLFKNGRGPSVSK